MKIIKNLLLAILVSISVFACTKDGGPGRISEGGSAVGGDVTGSGFISDCGVSFEGELYNPINPEAGVITTATSVPSPNTVIIQLSEGPALVKLSGLSNVESFRDDAAMNFLRNKVSGQALYFYEATKDCTDFINGGEAMVGELFTAGGENISESVIKAGLARIDRSERCVPDELIECYDALHDSSDQIGGVVSNFLWKPVAEKDGNLVVLTNPFNTTIRVNGQTLTSTGASNGRGTTARGNKPGCAYGRATVTVTNSDGAIVLFPNGSRSFTIENGCDRVELR